MFSKGTKKFDLIKCDVGNVIVTNMEKGKQKQKRDTHIVERSKFWNNFHMILMSQIHW